MVEVLSRSYNLCFQALVHLLLARARIATRRFWPKTKSPPKSPTHFETCDEKNWRQGSHIFREHTSRGSSIFLYNIPNMTIPDLPIRENGQCQTKVGGCWVVQVSSNIALHTHRTARCSVRPPLGALVRQEWARRSNLRATYALPRRTFSCTINDASGNSRTRGGCAHRTARGKKAAGASILGWRL
jgi:hypothetical protein